MSDPLDELRGLWNELEVPDLETLDPETERTIAWLRAAWNELEAPPYVAPGPQPKPRPWAPLLTGLAATLLVWLSARSLPTPALPALPAHVPTQAPRLDPPAVQASIQRDGSAVLRSGVVTLVLLDESATPVPIPTNPNQPGENR